jgi:putative PIN family toxin of toxin-antitoxin system
MPFAPLVRPTVRAVVDTNVVISGLLWPGPPAAVLDAAARRAFNLLTTPELIEELRAVLNRPHLASRLRARGRIVEEVISKQRFLATVAAPVALSTPANLRDLKDLPVLRCAIGGQAATIVTGDKDLLVLKEFQGVLIITPRIFLATLNL